MGPFQFETYHNPYVQSITQLMQAPAQAQAQAATTIGQAQAQAALARGQAWSGAIQNLGQIPLQIQAMRQSAARQAVEQEQAKSLSMKNALEAHQQAGEQAVSNALSTQQLPSGVEGPQPQTFMKDGPLGSKLVDIDALKEHLNTAPGHFGDISETLLSGAEKQNQRVLQAVQTRQNLRAETAAQVIQLIDKGVPFDQAYEMGSHSLLANQLESPQDVQQVGQQLAALKDPAAQRAALLNIVKTSTEKPEVLKKGDVQMLHGVQIGSGAPEPQKFQSKSVLLDGVPQEVSFDEGSGKYLFNGEDVTGRVQPVSTNKVDLQAKPDMVIKGTTNVPSFDPSNGKYMFDGKEVPADQVVRAAPPRDPVAVALQQIALQTAQQNLSDKQKRNANVAAISEGMKNGTIPPDPEGLSRQGIYADVVGQMAKDGVNFEELRKNWLATKRLTVTENSPQSNRLDIAVRSGLKMYDAVDALSSQWEGMGLGPLSRANLKLATEGAKGPEAAKLAIQLNGQIAQLTSDVATVEQNGMTPTQESRDVAAQSMQSWWGNQTIKAMTAQGRANMKIREAARNESTPLAPGQTSPSTTPPSTTTPVEHWERVNGVLKKVGG